MVQADSAIHQPLPDFIKLWNFGNPAETERKFRDILPQAESSKDTSYLAQLLTQIARTLSLRSKFEEAHTILDRVEKMLTPELSLARVRYLLERGRTFNSSEHQNEALPLFMEAYPLAENIGKMNLAVDAVHMVAIASKDPNEQVRWNLKGIEMAQANPDSHNWLWALYNNIGESFLLLKNYESARLYFHQLVEFEKARDGEPSIYAIKDEAKAIRLSGHPEEALALIEPALNKLLSEKEDNGWVREELAESLYALGKKSEAKPHFIKAYELLSKEDYSIEHEKEKLTHLKERAK